MALGLNLSSGGSSDDIIPFIKYDARSGRIFRNDRVAGANGYESQAVDITRSFKAVVDLEQFEVGWMLFGAGAAPQYAMALHGEPMPQRPTQEFRQGVRVMLKLHSSCASGEGDVRELTGNSAAFLRGVDALHDAYEAQKLPNNGKLPVVAMADSVPVTSGSGAKASTNYQPVFEIVGWAVRPKDLVFRPRAAAKPAAGAAAAQAPAAERTAPPSNGSTQVGAPAARAETAAARQPEMAMAGEDDFG